MPNAPAIIIRSLLATLLVAPAVVAQHPLSEQLESATHTVGFRSLILTDGSRHSAFADSSSGLPRKIQVSVWYPAQAGGGREMLLRDYVDLEALRTGAARPSLSEIRYIEREFGESVGLRDPEARNTAYRATMAAVLGAKPAEGRFPVVIYGASFNAPSWENAPLMELLAAKGYLVIASPSTGVSGAMTGDVAGMEAQALDLGVVLEYARRLPAADTMRMAVMGYSWGGLSNVIAQHRDSGVRALVALDGTIAFRPAVYFGSQWSDPAKLNVPALFFRSGRNQRTGVATRAPTSFTFFDSLTASTAYLLDMRELHHGHFSAMPFFFPRFTTQDIPLHRKGYNVIAEYTLAFLAMHLGGLPAAREYMSNQPEQNEVEAGFIEITRKTPSIIR